MTPSHSKVPAQAHGMPSVGGRVLLAVAFLVCVPAIHAADVDVEDLAPGLVTTYHDGAKPPVEVVRLEPVIAASWKAGETAHPRLAPDDNTVTWQGYLNVLRAGKYKFSAMLRGKVAVLVDGKDVLAAEEKADAGTLHAGAEVDLKSGALPIKVTFTRLTGPARLEVLWEAPFIRREPIAYDVLFHLPKKVPAKLAEDREVERGRFVAEELSCAACHKPADKLGNGLQNRQGPNLSDAGSRINLSWLIAWLENPQKIRPAAVMPRMFADDENGKVEAYAVARYLSSLGGPVKPWQPPNNPKDVLTSAQLGKKLFSSTGCVVCHRDSTIKETVPTTTPSFFYLTDDSGKRNYVLGSLGSKTNPERLRTYLENPLAHDPSGRMPAMLLEGNEAQDLAVFLCQEKDKAIDDNPPSEPAVDKLMAAFKSSGPDEQAMAAFEKVPEKQRVVELGKHLVISKGCANCHSIAPGGKALPTTPIKASFEAIQDKAEAGCLAGAKAKPGTVPVFAFGPKDVAALTAFLKKGAKGAGSPAPNHAAWVAVQRFNCAACHQRDGEGGLSPELIEHLRKFETAQNAETVGPPSLTGVGHKLRTTALRGVLTQRARARAWMNLRMPQFGDANVGPLAEAMSTIEGTEPDDTIHKLPINEGQIAAGRLLIGKTGFGCIACHDMAGHPNTGTRGPDLVLTPQRVRYDWYLRWLEQAQRMQPGTRMPMVFPDGKSPLPKVLDGSPAAQSDAMWSYLALGPGLPLPTGLEPPTKGRLLPVTDKPVLLRTFLPEVGGRADDGARGIAVGYPGGINVAFDANTCRLSYGWSGDFLDVSPVWDGRGGAPAHPLGARFWKAPTGCPWTDHDSSEPPDFAAMAKDPAYGIVPPEGKVYAGPRHLKFEGYSLNEAGQPTFRYKVGALESSPISVRERPEPLQSGVGYGVRRHFAVDVPADRAPWLLAGDTSGQPRLIDAKGNPLEIDLKAGRLELPTADRRLVLPQGDKVVVVSVAGAPEGAQWVLVKQGTAWEALLRLPKASKAGEHKFIVDVWSPFRDEPALIKELFSAGK